MVPVSDDLSGPIATFLRRIDAYGIEHDVVVVAVGEASLSIPEKYRAAIRPILLAVMTAIKKRGNMQRVIAIPQDRVTKGWFELLCAREVDACLENPPP
jgi:hypothetical protein